MLLQYFKTPERSDLSTLVTFELRITLLFLHRWAALKQSFASRGRSPSKRALLPRRRQPRGGEQYAHYQRKAGRTPASNSQVQLASS